MTIERSELVGAAGRIRPWSAASRRRLLVACGIALAFYGCALSLPAAAQEPDGPYKLLLLTIRVSGPAHEVIAAKVVESAVPLHLDAPRADAAVLNFSVTDGAGATLLEGSVESPVTIRTPLSAPGAPARGHETVTLEQSEYLLRLPYDERMKDLKLWFSRTPPSASAPRPGVARAASAEPEPQTIDLGPWLGKP